METEAHSLVLSLIWSVATYPNEPVVGFFGGTRGSQTGLLTWAGARLSLLDGQLDLRAVLKCRRAVFRGVDAAHSHDVAEVNYFPKPQKIRLSLLWILDSGTIRDKDFLKLCRLGPNQVNDIMESCWSLGLLVLSEFGFHRA